MKVQIYHNPRCSKSRETLELLHSLGFEPEIILYLQDTPAIETLNTLYDQLELDDVRDMMRRKDALYSELISDFPEYDKDRYLSHLHHYPQLLERPIVVYGDRAKIGRPPEQVLTLFPALKP